MSTSTIEISSPAPSVLTVVASPTLSIRMAPVAKPKMLPRIAVLEIHAFAVALTRVGKSSERWAPKDGVSIVAPRVAMKIEMARNQPESSR